VTAFAAVEELLLAGTVGAARGMVSLWSQRRGQLLTCSRAAPAPILHVWDLSTERCVQRLLSGLEGADHHITALGELGGAHSPAVLAAGASDGAIRLYDCRAGCYAFLAATAEHRAPIVGLCSHRDAEPLLGGGGGARASLVSADTSGEVRIWDARNWSAAAAADTQHRSSLSCLALHEHAPVRADAGLRCCRRCEQVAVAHASEARALPPRLSLLPPCALIRGCPPLRWSRARMARIPGRPQVMAAGSRNQFIKVFDLKGEVTNLIRYHDGFLGTRIGPVSSLAFHPRLLLMAAGASDSVVSIYGSL
jgi:WD40 repeat protein